MRLDNDKLKQSLFLIALFALGGFLLWLGREFINASLAALIFYILFRQPFFYLTEHKKWNKQLTIVLLIFVSAILLVLPFFLATIMLSSKVAYVIQHYQELLQYLQQWSVRAKEYIGVDLLSQDSVNKLTTLAANTVPKFISATVGALIDVFVLYFMFYFMLANAQSMEHGVRKHLPFKFENNQLLIRELKRQTIASSIGVPALVIVTAIVAGIGYWIFGVANPFFWGVLTGIGSVLPVIGIGLIWVPVVVYLFVSGHTGAGIGLLLYCIIVFSIVENGFRIFVLKKLGDIHPLITFFGVLMGLEMFGFVGIIFGPLMISYFLILLKIYQNEYMETRH